MSFDFQFIVFRKNEVDVSWLLLKEINLAFCEKYSISKRIGTVFIIMVAELNRSEDRL